MKLSTRKKFGYIHCRGGRVLEVLHDHDVPTNTYNKDVDQHVKAHPAFTKDPVRTFSGAYARAKHGDLAIEIVAARTAAVLGYAYLSGEAICLHSYDVAPHRFQVTEAAIARFDPMKAPTIEELASGLMWIKYHPTIRVFGAAIRASDHATSMDLIDVFAHCYAMRQADNDTPKLTERGHLIGTIGPGTELEQIGGGMFHFQPRCDATDNGVQPFHYTLLMTSPNLVEYDVIAEAHKVLS